MATMKIRGSTQIVGLSVTAAELASDSVTTLKIAALAVTEAKIAALAVTTAKIAALAVTSAELATGSVITAKIAAGAVTATELGTDAVIEAKIQNLAVTSGKLAASAVIAGKIAAGAIVDADVNAAAAIASTKLAAWAADRSAGGFKLTNLGAPTSAGDAATKTYVDAVKTGLDVKDSVVVATTANITLSGEQTIDGVLTSTSRVLVKEQTLPAQNGIYVSAAGAWARSADADSDAEVTGGMYVFVTQGTTNADAGFVLTANDPITVGTTALTFAQFSGAGQVTAGAGMTKTGNTLDVIAADTSITVNADSLQVNLAAGGTLAVSSGLKVADGGITNTQVGAGAAIDYSKLDSTDFVVGEAFAGDGATTVFNLASTPILGKERLFLNGVRQRSGAGNDYTISGAAITMASAPATGDTLLADYIK